jgi:glycosyl transferase family 1
MIIRSRKRAVRSSGVNSERPIWDDRSASRRFRPFRVSVLSPPDLFADRTVALLNSLGVDARRPRPVDSVRGLSSRLERTRRGLATDVVLHMSGKQRLSRLQSCLAWLGVPTVMLWIGSDVALHAPKATRTVIAQTWHWCVAPWLRDELAEDGIEADIVRLTPPRMPDRLPALPLSFTVLAYALDDRSELYGLDFVLELARRRPDIQFLLLATCSTEVLPENVRALGWVNDTHAVMSQTTLYVRPTSHDGLSNLVLEALAYGRYVLWTYPFPGVEAADTVDAAEARLNELYRLHMAGRLYPNHEGRKAVLEMFEPSVVGNDALRRLSAIAEQGWRRPPASPMRWIAHALVRIFKVILLAEKAWATGYQEPAIAVGRPLEEGRRLGVLPGHQTSGDAPAKG